MNFAKINSINYANVVHKIPLPTSSVEVCYASHMLEHLDRKEAQLFLAEAKRVLKDKGILRVVVPNLKQLADEYQLNGDANRFIKSSLLTADKSHGFLNRLKSLISGARHHQWMYDEKSLCVLLMDNGFTDTIALQAGQTRIQNPGELNLRERFEESIYVEAISKSGQSI